MGEGEVTRTVCFSKDEKLCERNQEIRVKNCSDYFVYWLWPTTENDAVYCTVTDSALGDPCVTHTVLDQPWRSTNCSNTECTGEELMDDKNLAVGWYRFNSSGGWKIPETVVPQHHCSGKKPGWLNGPHPNMGEGEVTRTVCFSKDEKLCERNQEIRVKNCSGYFVYWLWPTTENDAVEMDERFARLHNSDTKFGFLLNVEGLCYGANSNDLKKCENLGELRGWVGRVGEDTGTDERDPMSTNTRYLMSYIRLSTYKPCSSPKLPTRRGDNGGVLLEDLGSVDRSAIPDGSAGLWRGASVVQTWARWPTSLHR
ncbi:uncharacterized protein [Hemitrygon akajei]|uniref:uncharacterized protein n=1 Tax=Hemitrygon akajei TaxID=2704970 RepID=UPI003BF9FD36